MITTELKVEFPVSTVSEEDDTSSSLETSSHTHPHPTLLHRFHDDISEVSSHTARPTCMYFYKRGSSMYWDFISLLWRPRRNDASWTFKPAYAVCAWCSRCQEPVPFRAKDDSHVIAHMENFHCEYLEEKMRKQEERRKKKERRIASDARQLSILQFLPAAPKVDSKHN